MYHILPLQWEDRDGFSLAFIGFGHYEVNSAQGWSLRRPRGCYGKSTVKCDSLAGGKKKAEAHYRKLMESNLCQR